jgi:hypothetical protein
MSMLAPVFDSEATSIPRCQWIRAPVDGIASLRHFNMACLQDWKSKYKSLWTRFALPFHHPSISYILDTSHLQSKQDTVSRQLRKNKTIEWLPHPSTQPVAEVRSIEKNVVPVRKMESWLLMQALVTLAPTPTSTLMEALFAKVFKANLWMESSPLVVGELATLESRLALGRSLTKVAAQ